MGLRASAIRVWASVASGGIGPASAIASAACGEVRNCGDTALMLYTADFREPSELNAANLHAPKLEATTSIEETPPSASLAAAICFASLAAALAADLEGASAA